MNTGKTLVSEDAPSYWFGPGLAPLFNRQVAKANEAVKAAEQALQDALRLGYPQGRRVAVIHPRGQFHGHVVGWDYYGCRVAVKNENTLRVSKWWAAHVQLCPSAECFNEQGHHERPRKD